MTISSSSPADLARKRLLTLLKQLSFSKRDVTLASGQKSNFYFDCKQTTLHAEGSRLCGELLWRLSRDWEPQAVGGPTMGADPLTISVMNAAYQNDQIEIPGYIIRKQAKSHGTSAWIEGVQNLPAGGRLVMLEDVITTGGSALRAVKRAREEGFVVVGVAAIVDRGSGGSEAFAEAGLDYRYLFSAEEFL